MKIDIVAIDKVYPYQNNPRLNEAAIKPVADSIREFGFRQPIVVDKAMVIIAGHTRWLAAKSLGLANIPIHIANDLSDVQIKAYRLADNKTGEFAEWDLGALRIELNDLKAKEYDVSLTGFTIRDLALMGTSIKDGKTDPDEVPAIPETPRSKLGQLWKLGNHRLLCGDATDMIAHNKVMDGGVADMVFTDPPYNVNYEGATKDKLKIQNDNMGDDTFYEFLFHAFKNIFAKLGVGCPVYVCYASSEGLNFYKAFKDSGLLMKQELIWVKNQMVLGRQDYKWQHEPIIYGWKPGEAHRWYGDFDKKTVIDDDIDIKEMSKPELIKIIRQFQNDKGTTVIRENKPVRSDMHPTMKPVGLIQNFILNSTEKDNIVLDPFGGSGSTMIACEQNYRSCRMIEYDPKYCDVIIDRWEKFTGKKAERLEGTE